MFEAYGVFWNGKRLAINVEVELHVSFILAWEAGDNEKL